MCDLKICRICLRTECKFYKSDQVPLKYYYEEIVGFEIKEDKLPRYFCYECATLLHKFHKLREKCFHGQNILHNLIYGNLLNYAEVHRLYRKITSQPLPYRMNLSIMKISERVKTYNYKHNDEDDDEDDYEEEVEIIDNKTNLGNNVKEELNDHNFISNVDNKEQPLNPDINTETAEKPLLEDDDFDDEHYFDGDFILNNKPKETQNDRIPSPISSDDELLSTKVEKKSNELKEDVSKEPIKKVMKFQREKKGPPKLSEGNWKKIILTDEEALQKFEAKAFDNKYLSAKYKCAQCYRWFAKEDKLRRHTLMRHKQSLPHGCRFCKLRFRLNHRLQEHLKQHYQVFECKRCNLTCPLEQTAIFHDELHNGIIRKCQVCHREFTHSSTYYSHMTTHRTNFVCTICGRSFVSKVGLKLHKKRTHAIQAEKPDQSESEAIYCERCDIKFEARAAYEEHLFHSANHTEDIVDVNNELQRFQKKVCGIKEKAVLAEEIRNRRDQDPALMLPKPILKTCVRTQKKIPMNCYHCGKHFVSQMQCRKHHYKEHPRTTFVYPGMAKKTICEICGADIAFNSVMAHLNMHSGEKVFKCEICEKTFVQKATLKRHMLTHTGEKRYPCSLCDKRFTQSNSQQLHYRTVHLKEPHPIRNRRKKVLKKEEESKSS